MQLALDGFKSVDDVHGYTPGDRVLPDVAAELLAARARGSAA
ncbi:hypothetical protein [Methylobacterium sp. WL12]|nr:hypothetical protein [Methylobacterium sp. WL12]